MPLPSTIIEEIKKGDGRFVKLVNGQLHVDLNNQGITDKEIEELIPVCKGKSIGELNLEHNNISSEGAVLIAKNFTHIQKLNFQRNNLNDKAAEPLSSLTSLTELNIGDNQLTKDGIHILEKKFKHIKLLTHNNPGTAHRTPDPAGLAAIMSDYIPPSITEVILVEETTSSKPKTPTFWQPSSDTSPHGERTGKSDQKITSTTKKTDKQKETSTDITQSSSSKDHRTASPTFEKRIDEYVKGLNGEERKRFINHLLELNSQQEKIALAVAGSESSSSTLLGKKG